MKQLSIVFLGLIIFSCNNKAIEIDTDKRIVLKKDSINMVNLGDTLVLYESTCRGCAYEASTTFAVSDSLNVIKLAGVLTADNNSSEMAGGSISKELVLVPVKKGSSIFKIYKFWSQQTKAKDSANFTTYKIQVQ